MPLSLRLLIAVPLVLVFLACAFGFVATFEPGTGHMTWRVGYAAAGTLCLVGVVLVLTLRRRK